MSWLARSFVNSLRSNDADSDSDDETSAPTTADPDSPTRGVKEDLSELTQTLTRQFWGVASFLAPPPEPSVNDAAESPRFAAIKSDFAEIGGRVRSGISLLSSNKAVSEISKMASTLFGSEEGDDDEEGGIGAVGVAEDVIEFVRNISMHPETWLDFPLLAEFDDSYVSGASPKIAPMDVDVPPTTPTQDNAALPEYPPYSPNYSSTHEAAPYGKGNIDAIMWNAINAAAARPVVPSLQENANAANPPRPEGSPKKAPQALPVDAPQGSMPLVNTARRDGKAPMSEFLPVTPDDVPITKDNDHEDVGVIQGLLESTFLNGHLEYYRSSSCDPQSLLNSSMKGIYWGLSDMIQAKRIMDEKFSYTKAQVSSLKSKLVDADKVVAAQQAEIDKLRSSLTYVSRTGTEELERLYAAYRGVSERTINDLQKDLRVANTKLASYTEQLSSSREARVGLQMENNRLQSEVQGLKDYSAGIQHRHTALMVLLANLRLKHQEWIDERQLIVESNQALHKALVDLGGAKEENKLMAEELEEMKLCAAKHTETLAKLISESGRMRPIPANMSLTDPRRFLLESWHPEEARLREELANLKASIPGKLRHRFREIEQESFERAMKMAADAYTEGYKLGYNQGRDMTIANITDTGRLGAEIDEHLDKAIFMLSDGNSERAKEALKSLRLARELSSFGCDVLCFQNR